MRPPVVLAMLALAIVVPGGVQAAAGATEEHCQDPRISGAFCAVCWEFLEPMELQDQGPWNAPKWKCAETEMPN